MKAAGLPSAAKRVQGPTPFSAGDQVYRGRLCNGRWACSGDAVAGELFYD